MVLEELRSRNIPDVFRMDDGHYADSPDLWRKRREEMLELLSREMYGFSPPPPGEVRADVLMSDEKAFGGKAAYYRIKLSFDTPGGEFSFPFSLAVPKEPACAPVFLLISFSPHIADICLPAEEILDEGFAVASFYYADVAPDTDDGFSAGIAAMYGNGRRGPDSWGKISMWAWAASRVMDHLQSRKDIDTGKIVVAGHSRLGKTALWCAAQDERFAGCISNDSGCSGAAITRGKKGEHVSHITGAFGYWFCENFRKYADREDEMPFDQHFVLSLIAPRPLYVASASEDEWCDPGAEYLCCVAVSRVYEMLGKKGVSCGNGYTLDAADAARKQTAANTACKQTAADDNGSVHDYPKPGDVLHGGSIAYHLRSGTHFLGRYDWNCFIRYFRQRFSDVDAIAP